MDLTLMLMAQLIRVTYFAWAIYDMSCPPEKLLASSKGRVLTEFPSLFEFLAYNFNFLGLCCPSYDFFDFKEFIEEKVSVSVDTRATTSQCRSFGPST